MSERNEPRQPRPLGPREREIMEVLWSCDCALPVREVRARLAGDAVSYTTVMTILDNLHRKGWVQRERRGRGYDYRPTRSRTEHVAATMAAALGDSADRTGALTRFVGTITEGDQAVLRELLASLDPERPVP